MAVESRRAPLVGFSFELLSGSGQPRLPPLPPGACVDRLALGRARARVWGGPDPLLGDEPSAAVHGPLLVVVQGCIDYAGELGLALPEGASTAQIAAAAYSRWKREVVHRLEGDYAVVIWDEDTHTLLAYRSFPGPYPVFYAETTAGAGSFVMSSSISGVLEHPDVGSGLNVAAVAEAAGGLLFGEHGETVRRSIRVLDPGWAVVQRNAASPQRFRAWKPEVNVAPGPRSGGPEELMELIRAAVRERCAAKGATAVWLSGGFDSSAVFAAAMSGVKSKAFPGDRIRAISISYPEGDDAREDLWIEATTRRWNTSPVWINSELIAVRVDLENSGQNRDEPFVHLFDTWNAALAQATHDSGARVALGGDGGDQLFQATPIHLADLARTLRPIQLVREFRALGGRSLRSFARLALAPLAPRQFAGVYEGFRGLPFPDTERIGPPSWLAREFVKRHSLLDRNRELPADHIGRSRAAREAFRQASSTFFGRVATEVRQVARARDVLHRSPLWDRRVVEFALQRPFAERIAPRDSKVLLRAAMRGLIPDEVLAPRPIRTGAPDSVFDRFMRDGVLPTIDRLGPLKRLADLGILEPNRFQISVDHYRQSPSFFHGVQIAFSVDTECWLRGLA